MRHLFMSTVQVKRLSTVVVNGRAETKLVPAEGSTDRETKLLAALPCRLDLNFIRPGKDQPPAIEAGTVPDRIGVMFYNAPVKLRAGDTIDTIPNPQNGKEPVSGRFEIRVVPDDAIDYSGVHHKEVQVIEDTQPGFEDNWDTGR